MVSPGPAARRSPRWRRRSGGRTAAARSSPAIACCALTAPAPGSRSTRVSGRSSPTRSAGTGSSVPDSAQTALEGGEHVGPEQPGGHVLHLVAELLEQRGGVLERRRAPPAPARRRASPTRGTARSAAGRPAARRSRGTSRRPAAARAQYGSPGTGPAIASSIAAASRTVRASGPLRAQPGDLRAERRVAHPAAAGLDPEQPVDAGRDADRPAAVAALRERHAARRRPRRPPRRWSRRPAGRVPRAARRADEVVVGVAGEAELRGVGLAQADRPGGGQRGDHGVVDVGHEVGGDPRSRTSSARPAVLLRSLIAVGTPSSGGSSPPARTRPPRRAAAAASARSGVTVMNAPEPGVQRVDPGEAVLDQLGRAHLAARGRRRPARARSGRAARVTTPRTLARRVDSVAVDLTRDAAAARDDADPLAGFRARFAGARRGPDRLLYLDGNSLGRLPVETPAAVARVVEQEWGRGLVGSWSSWIERGHAGSATRWPPACSAPARARCWSATPPRSNLYKLLVAGADARPGRDVLVCTADDFPTDRYIVAGRRRGPRHDRAASSPADIDEGLDLGGARARRWTSGSPSSSSRTSPTAPARWPTWPAVTRLVHDAGRARAVGPLARGRRGAGGARPPPAPTSPSAAPTSTSTAARGRRRSSTCARELQEQLRQPIWGWFGQRDQFAMGPAYDPAPGIERFGVGTPPVLAMAAVEVGARLVAEAGIDRLAAKGRALTELMVALADEWLAPHGVVARLPAGRRAARLARHPRPPAGLAADPGADRPRRRPRLPHARPAAARARRRCTPASSTSGTRWTGSATCSPRARTSATPPSAARVT